MQRSLEATIIALLAVGMPNQAKATTCDSSPVIFLGNSFNVALKNASRKPSARRWGVTLGNLVTEDANPYTNDNNNPRRRCSRRVKKRVCRTNPRTGAKRCRTYTKVDRSRCDTIAFTGRTVYEMLQKLDKIKAELTRLGSHRVVLYEGPNSLNPGRNDEQSETKKIGGIRRVLKKIVDGLQGHTVNQKNVEVYLATMPDGVIGYSKNLNFYSISLYNNMLNNLGADGVIDISDIAWKQGTLHGYQRPFTFQQILAGIHDKVNPDCGYASHPKQHYDDKWVAYQRRVSERMVEKRRRQMIK
ncbi:hypothetical protein ACFL3V_06545 [Nanoarchaeota archaeon]